MKQEENYEMKTKLIGLKIVLTECGLAMLYSAVHMSLFLYSLVTLTVHVFDS